MIPGEKVRIGVIGIGNMGSEHCRNLYAGRCPEITLTAAADLREDRRLWAEANLRGVHVYASGQELIREEECDAVLICVPHFGHEEMAVAAMEAGLHVLCEKPISVTAKAARNMIRSQEKTGKTLALMFNQRTNCLYRGIHDVLQSGEYGNIKRVNWIITDWYRTQRYYDSGTWRSTWAGEGGGVLLNQCPHQLDLLIWMCGMPERVRAVCHEGKWHRIEVEDDVTAYFEFPNGATGSMVFSTGDLPGTNRLEIDCEMGKIVCEDGLVRCWKLNENERNVCFSSDNPWYKPQCTVSILKTDGLNPQHIGVLNEFAAHLLHGVPLTADAQDGLNAITLSNAIHLAGWTGREIGIPVDEELFVKMLDKKIAASGKKSGVDITFETDHMGTGALQQN